MEMPSTESSPFALKYQLEQNLLPFSEDEVRELPEDRTGLYTLWLPSETGGGYEYIYVGMSSICLRRRLLQHLQRETNPELRRQIQLFRDIVAFSVAFTRSREETRPLEKRIIADWRPFTNRQGKQKRESRPSLISSSP